MATGEQILILENDPDVADLIGRQSLQPLGYEVIAVGDAASAIKFAIQNTPALILANLNFPGLSGKDMLAALSAQGVRSPVIVIAEKGQETDAIQAFRLGAADVMFWPLKDAEVVSIVERALRQTQETRERQKLDRQLKATNEELQRKLRDLTTILSTAKAVVSVTDQRILFDMILESALRLADADMCWLLLREERSKAFLMRAQRGLPDSWARKMNQPVDDGISSLVALSGESLVMSGVPLQKLKVSTLGRSIAVIPIKIQSEVIGLLLVVRKADREISRDTQTLLEAMADFASISLVNARLFHALENTAENARTGENLRHAALESVRAAIRNELAAAGYPLNFVLTETSGKLTSEQRQALESVQAALLRLARSSETTIVPAQQTDKGSQS